ncbi:MAG: MFS transporter [Candidatus Paceibacterota bacterium]
MQYNKKIIYLAGFLFSLSIALMAYINSSFLSSFVDEKLVGIIYSLGSLFLILMLLIIPRIFRKMGGYKFIILITSLNILSILTFVLSKNSWFIILAFILSFTLNTIIIFSLDEFLEIFSKDSKTGRIRGIYLTITSLAWIFSQLILTFGKTKGSFSFENIYLIAFFIMILFFILSLLTFKNVTDPKYDKIKTIKFVGKFFKNKNLFRVYSINFLLQFFYSWMVIYTPIYLSVHIGFDWKQIGMIFSIMLLPFVIFPFQLGKYSDIIGERKMLMLGFTISSLATLSLFFIGKPEVSIWAFALFITRIGAATIEIMSDAYFFKHIKPENEEFIGVYRSASPMAYVIGPILASITFLFIPSFNFIYVVLGTLMLYGVYLSSTIEKNDI